MQMIKFQVRFLDRKYLLQTAFKNLEGKEAENVNCDVAAPVKGLLLAVGLFASSVGCRIKYSRHARG